MSVSGAFTRHGSSIGDNGAAVVQAALRASSSLAALIGDLPECDSAEALQAWLLAYAGRNGFRGGRYFHFGHFHSGQRAPNWKPLRFLSTHHDRADLWITDEVGPGAMLVTFLPFAWSNEDAGELAGPQRAWHEVHHLDRMPGGITVPVQDHATGPACLILFGGVERDAYDLVDIQTPSLAMTALTFHLLAKAILPARTALGLVLSDREIACLRLAAMGDTLAQTAAKLGISIRTVELHVGRATRKLSATNKIQAVAIAAGAGLIQI